MIQVLFPPWKFFVEMSQSPQLHYRIADAGDQFGDWIDAFPPPRRQWSTLFLNEEGNLLLAQHSLVEKFILEISQARDDEAVEKSVSYQLITELVRSRLHSSVVNFQFRISIFSIRDSSEEVVLLSPEIRR